MAIGKGIFNFERGCRAFYQMINNIYLSSSNNFKLTFIITNKTYSKQNRYNCIAIQVYTDVMVEKRLTNLSQK